MSKEEPECCTIENTKVIDSRQGSDSSIRRRRECLLCSLRFTTYEKIHSQLLNVVKKDNTKEAFSLDKLTKSISTACKKRPVSIDKIEKIGEDIETNLLQNYGAEIESRLIGQLVLNELMNIDKVSYIRFSSVSAIAQKVLPLQNKWEGLFHRITLWFLLQ